MPTSDRTGPEGRRPWAGRGRRWRHWFDETGLLEWLDFEPAWWGLPPKPAWPTEEQEIEELKAQAERLQQELDE